MQTRMIQPVLSMATQLPILHEMFKYDIVGETDSPFGVKRLTLSNERGQIILEEISLITEDGKPYLEVMLDTEDDFSDITHGLNDEGYDCDKSSYMKYGFRLFNLGFFNILLRQKEDFEKIRAKVEGEKKRFQNERVFIDKIAKTF
jgi:hypothetical protein